MNCRKCIYVGSVPNSVHCSCHHPMADEIIGNSELLMRMMENIIQEARLGYTGSLELEIDEEYREYALASGYVLFPINFDPRWINQCKGYTTGDE